jgi:hypothetical protein
MISSQKRWPLDPKAGTDICILTSILILMVS